ncbi:PAS domain S-box protein [Lacibacter sediminis]|uniref:PAS domain S-box protein n=1 Tax=Lacibacter sediminis TaxID=2760713 RepID=A0A7G5XE60_9BACT|nr:PAS domain S-box protein [Lacibacter sediminis]QNA43763.1 PAS domain S-box protein [Lacibacter sediminis]
MRNFFSVPDKEKNYQEYMVYVLAIIWSVVTGLIVSVGFYFFPEIWQRWLTLLIVAIFICLFNLALNRFGYTKLASWSFTIMLWLFNTIPCYSAGGIIAPGILSQISVILTAGFLLGWRGGMAIGILTIFTDFGLVYLELTGQLPIPSVMHTPVTRWITAIIPFGTVLALQYYATNHLRSGLLAMQREIVKREDAEKIKDTTLHSLQERLKELKTLYSVNQILQNEDASYQQIVGEIAQALPLGWQYPDITAARVRIADTEFATKNYVTSEYSQQVEVKSALGTKAFIEVVYLKPMPEFDEGPFLKEERDLINMLAEMLKIDLDRRERTVELKDYKYALDVASIVSISDVNGLFQFVNENFCKASKYKREELSGKHHSIIWSNFHPVEYFDEIRLAMQNGTPFRGEFCNKAKDGTLYWVDSSIVPFVDKNGKVYQYLSISYDITKQKNAEHLIKEQAAMFKAIIENTKESIYLIAPDYKILQFNTTAKERIEITRGMELHIGADFRDYLFQDISYNFYPMFYDSLKGIDRSEEFRAKGVNDQYFWFQAKTSPVYDLRGELIGVRLLTESINDRKQAEALLRENEEKFRSIVEQSLVGIFIIREGRLIYVNPGFEKIFGYSKDKLVNRISFEDLVHEDDVEIVRDTYRKRIKKQKPKEQYIFRAIRNDGVLLHIEVIASLITYDHEPAVIGTLVDITDRIEEERRISKAVLDAQENERLQIGMELHDNVKQILAGSGLYLDMVQNKLNDKAAVSNILVELKKFNAQAITEVRRLSHQLAPLVEEDTKLNDKIEWLIGSLKLKELVSVSIQINEFEEPLDNSTQLTFYRILQEQLSNIVKHAKASLVEINIRSVNDHIYLQVKDNGIGFDVNSKKEGIGLANIRRRVQLLNGKVEVVSFPDKGCEINIHIPKATVLR